LTLLKEKTMMPCCQLRAPLLMALLAMPYGAIAADLLTMEQAEALSKATGRPILAMAGSKT
jgi:hypothetical protein